MSKFTRGVVGLCLLASGLTFGTDQATAAPVAGAGGRVALQSPVRVQDSRTLSTPQAGVTTATLGSDQILNVTLVAYQMAGSARLHACGAPASSGQDGNVCLYTSGSAHLIADLGAWYQPSLPVGFEELEPVRVLDTRNAVGIAGKTLVGASSITALALAGRGGVPATGAEAVTLNITVDQPQGGGFVTVFPCGQDVPTASNLNFSRGQTIANLVNVKLAANGTVCIFTSASAHVLADVAGYSTTTPEFYWITRLTHLSQAIGGVAPTDPTQLLSDAANAARRFTLG